MEDLAPPMRPHGPPELVIKEGNVPFLISMGIIFGVIVLLYLCAPVWGHGCSGHYCCLAIDDGGYYIPCCCFSCCCARGSWLERHGCWCANRGSCSVVKTHWLPRCFRRIGRGAGKAGEACRGGGGCCCACRRAGKNADVEQAAQEEIQIGYLPEPNPAIGRAQEMPIEPHPTIGQAAQETPVGYLPEPNPSIRIWKGKRAED